jgi:hypoxanthine phosphoribosyltransferase
MQKEVTLFDKTFELFISEAELIKSAQNIAAQINEDYKGRKPIFLCVLNGSFLYAADLIKAIDLECEVQFVKVSSYQGTSSTGQIKSLIGLDIDITNRDIILVEDIVDTGLTIDSLVKDLKGKNPASIKITTLLFKPKAYQKEVPIDYVALEVPNDFLVGYGLDYDGFGRNLRDIYTLKKN